VVERGEVPAAVRAEPDVLDGPGPVPDAGEHLRAGQHQLHRPPGRPRRQGRQDNVRPDPQPGTEPALDERRKHPDPALGDPEGRRERRPDPIGPLGRVVDGERVTVPDRDRGEQPHRVVGLVRRERGVRHVGKAEVAGVRRGAGYLQRAVHPVNARSARSSR